MRFKIWLLVATFLPMAFACGTCSLSGDQHFITLNGAQHHYYGRGWHRLYHLDRFEVQCLFADCKTGAETIDGHCRRNNARRICLQACRARFHPPGSICAQTVNWEPLQVNGEGQSLIEVNGARLQMGKGISQAGKDQSWWLRIERVSKDAVAIDAMVGEGAGGLSLRLGPKRIVTVTVRGLQGGRGLCGSCDDSNTNDLAGVGRLNISDIEGHNRFADPHRRGAAGFALIPAKPECAGGSSIQEQEEVDKLLKEAGEAREHEEYVHKGNLKLAEIGAETFRDGAPDYDPNLIVPPAAMFANQTLLADVVRDCRAGMILSANDDRMRFAIDNCVLDKARGHGFEVAAASNIIAYVQSLMIDEQSDLALHRLPLAKNFCAMCQSAIQTFVVDTKPILRHSVEKQAHYFDPGVAVYSPLAPAPFELAEADPTPRPTRPPLPMPTLTSGILLPLPTLLSEKNGSADRLPSNTGFAPSTPIPDTTQNSSMALAPPKRTVTSNDAALEPPVLKNITNATIGSGHKTDSAPRDSATNSKPNDSEHSKEKDGPTKKSRSKDDSDSGKYHLKGSKPVSNEEDDYDDDDEDDDGSTHKHRSHSHSSKSGKKEKKRRQSKESDEELSEDDEAEDSKEKAKPKPAPSPEPKSVLALPPLTPAPTPFMTRAPILPGASNPEQTAADPISNMSTSKPISSRTASAKSNASNVIYPTIRATAVRT